jgi:hypothetical protein
MSSLVRNIWRKTWRWRTFLDEPERTVREALKLLGRLSAGGIAIPEDLVTTVLKAKRELETSDTPIGAERASAIYDAYRKLAILGGRLEDVQEVRLADSFFRAAINSEYLLKFASENGTAVPPSVQTDLIAGQAAIGTQPDREVKAKFYAAYAVLARLLGSVTADTIKACRSSRTRRALDRDVTLAIVLTVLTVFISVLLFTADQINKQLKDEVTAANDSAIKLRGTVFPSFPSASPPVMVRDEYVKEPCAALTLQPAPGEFTIKSQADLDQIQSFAIAIRDARARANKLNLFILYMECDPFGECWWRNGQHNQNVAAMRDKDAKPRLRDRLELNPTLGNYTAEFLCKVQTWQEVRDFSLNVQKTYEATFGAFVSQVLPVLYALLGAYAFRLRQFSETVRNRTFHPSFADSARLITAIIAGTVAGLFNPVSGLSVSPLAAAFLIGYGVEIFFRFLDTLLNSFGSGATKEAARPAGEPPLRQEAETAACPRVAAVAPAVTEREKSADHRPSEAHSPG